MVIFMELNTDSVSLEKKKKEEQKKLKKKKAIDRLFKRIFLSALLLLILCLSDNLKVNNIKKALNHNINFMKIAKIFNGSLGIFTPSENIVEAYTKETYDFSNFDGKYNYIENYTTDAISTLSSGVVVRIEKTNDKYNVFVLDVSGTIYGYLDLEVINHRIYDYINKDDIIGKAFYNMESEAFEFKLTIEDKGIYYDYYQKAENNN